MVDLSRRKLWGLLGTAAVALSIPAAAITVAASEPAPAPMPVPPAPKLVPMYNYLDFTKDGVPDLSWNTGEAEMVWHRNNPKAHDLRLDFRLSNLLPADMRTYKRVPFREFTLTTSEYEMPTLKIKLDHPWPSDFKINGITLHYRDKLLFSTTKPLDRRKIIGSSTIAASGRMPSMSVLSRLSATHKEGERYAYNPDAYPRHHFDAPDAEDMANHTAGGVGGFSPMGQDFLDNEEGA